MEFRSMRRSKQVLTMAECEEILHKNTAGVLAVLGDGGYPYAVPLSYIYLDGKLYFHCAKQGHKLDAIKMCDKVSFCVIDQDVIVPEEYTTLFRSVIAFGRAKTVDDESEIVRITDDLAKKYAPESTAEHRQNAIEKSFAALCIVQIDIDYISGKQGRELAEKSTKHDIT